LVSGRRRRSGVRTREGEFEEEENEKEKIAMFKKSRL
jgi:hypothetical protein